MAQRDFQWTTYEPRRAGPTAMAAPPPLPSLPPWAQQTVATAAPVPVPTSQSSASIHDPHAAPGWRRPTSYFGAMKRLPLAGGGYAGHGGETDLGSQQSHEDEERQRHNMDEPQEQQQPSQQQHYHHHHHHRQRTLHESPAAPRAAAPGSSNQHSLDDPATTPPTTVSKNYRQPHDRDWNDGSAIATEPQSPSPSASSPPPPPPSSSSSSSSLTPEDSTSTLSSPDPEPTAPTPMGNGTFFRQWKRDGHNNNNNGDDADAEVATVNKWKVRALSNPFAKRKTHGQPQSATMATPANAIDPDEQQQQQQQQQQQSVSRSRDKAQSTRHDANDLKAGASATAVEPECPSPAPAPAPRPQHRRPRTPTIPPAAVPAPTTIVDNNRDERSSSSPPCPQLQLQQQLRPGRSRESILGPSGWEPRPGLSLAGAFVDGPEEPLPLGLGDVADLRKSTTVLAPLMTETAPPLPAQALAGGHRRPSPFVSATRPLGVGNAAAFALDEDDGDSPESRLASVLNKVPARPAHHQLQQLPTRKAATTTSSNNNNSNSNAPIKPPSSQPPPPQKKGSTLDALNEIKRRREERRSAHAEEKQRIKAELAEHGDDAGYKFRRLVQRFRAGLPAWQSQQSQSPQSPPSGRDATSDGSRLSVFVRKRPLAKKELKARGYDILTCLYAGPERLGGTRSELMCHEPKLKVDCSETLENHAFHFDGVFDELQSNELVYGATVGPLIPLLRPPPPSSSSLATASKTTTTTTTTTTTSTTATSLTVFAYGQTGSGKTYTMKSIYRQAAVDLFALLDEQQQQQQSEQQQPSPGAVTVGVSFYEIYLNHVNDLLHGRARVQLMEDGDGTVQLLGLTERTIAGADELMALIQRGEEARATSANAVHDDSSRSHALLRVTLYGGGVVVARLSMVDLAGSERACDTQSDSKGTRQEGAEINKSLLALKECIRALDRGQAHIPFRQSKLTQLLRDSFLSATSRTVMIATVSPCSESANHTLNTLRYADRLKEIGGGAQ